MKRSDFISINTFEAFRVIMVTTVYTPRDLIDISIDPCLLLMFERYLENVNFDTVLHNMQKSTINNLPPYNMELKDVITEGSSRFTSAHFGEDSCYTALAFKVLRENIASKMKRKLKLPNDIHYSEERGGASESKLRYTKNKNQTFDIITVHNKDPRFLSELFSISRQGTIIVILTNDISDIAYYYFWFSSVSDISIRYILGDFKWRIDLTNIRVSREEFLTMQRKCTISEMKQIQNRVGHMIRGLIFSCMDEYDRLVVDR